MSDQPEKYRILVIDDNPSIHEDIRKVLLPSNDRKNALEEAKKALFGTKAPEAKPASRHDIYEIDSAFQGQEGLELIKKQQLQKTQSYSLAFVDMKMPPGWDGIETITNIWMVDPKIQVVICTAYVDYSWDNIINLLKSTDNLLILKKPFDLIEVRQLAHTLTKKWALSKELEKQMQSLEQTVADKTQELKDFLALMRSTIESTADAILVVNQKGKILYYNRKFIEMWNIPEYVIHTRSDEEALQFVLEQLDKPEAFLKKVKELYSQPSVESFDEFKFKDGRYIERFSTTYKLGNDAGRVWSFRDVTSRILLQEELIHRANYDALTDLPNKTLLLDRLTQAILLSKRLNNQIYIIFLDIDEFKIINDTLGHHIGDGLLHAVGTEIRDNLRESDTVARFGGDEFVILLPSIQSLENLNSILFMIRRIAQKPFNIENQELQISISMGISSYPKDGETATVLVRNADMAMYKAKEMGRGNYQFYHPTMNSQLSDKFSIENDLRHALDRNELFLVYQPIIDVQTELIVGVEALLRWQHPTRGLIVPNRFIGFAEELMLINPIGEWVLQTACHQNKLWQKMDLPHIYVSVNTSGIQFKTQNMVELIASVLKKTELDSKCLILEVTESIIMENPERYYAIFKQIQHLGVHLAMDDFGTGYSSLSYLKKFPIDILKIDKSFIHDIDTNQDDATIVKMILAMAKTLNMRVIAEGIEKENQLQFLRENNCSFVQGYYFSKPVLPNEIQNLLRQRL